MRSITGQFRMWSGWLGAALIVVYGLGMLFLLTVRWLVGERWAVIAFVDTGLHLPLIPALFLLPLCLIFRRWRLALLLTPPALLFIVTFLPFFLPQEINIPSGSLEIRFLTYNLHAEERLLAPMSDIIREADADIVAVQEMSTAAAAHLDTALADLYPYRALFPVSSPYHGRGLLSRYPIVTETSWPEEYPIPVRLQRAVVDVEGNPVVVYNFHAPPSRPIYQGPFDVRPRMAQTRALLDLARQDTGAVVLLGDFNTHILDENYAQLTAEYHDAFWDVGLGFGFTGPDWSHENSAEGPGWIPLYQRYDYLFYNDYFLSVAARVWPESGGSDHRPLLVTLVLVGE
ncbi:MAG: endonuclease/exonuclease/phosphatase family protein [Anaerolineaceae bacterium]|nr:endonuclease/exonuclease/phosphatase family protein [Anaerolineaceae bacterium]